MTAEERRAKNRECMRRYRETNPEKVQEARAANPEKYREAHRRWRAANPEKAREATRRWRAKNSEKVQEYEHRRTRILSAFRRLEGCVDCGTADGKLDFDHRDGSVKVKHVAGMRAWSWLRLFAEIQKCDVRCRSCHSRRHARKRQAA